ncbi:MAG: hypothetical protein C4317_00035 [Acidimicrobiia bacterium]
MVPSHRGRRGVPEEIVRYVGEDAEIVLSTDDLTVLTGSGYCAHYGLPEVIARERAVLLREFDGNPLVLPQVIDWDITWIITENLEVTSEWSDEEVFEAVRELARFHDTFEDSPHLVSPILRRPFGRDLPELLAPARASGWQLPSPLDEILLDPSPLIKALEEMPFTILHGDPWPANVAKRGSEFVWLNWWQTSLGPGVADFAAWLDQTPFQLGRTVDRLGQIEAYLEARGEPLDRKTFSRGLDAARIFWFLAYDVPQLRALAQERPDLAETMNIEAHRAWQAFEKSSRE